MKRFLFSMLALLSVMAINAQNWTEPSGNDFLTSTPIYVHVKVNGVVATSDDGLEVAAFINGECRAVTHTYDASAEQFQVAHLTPTIYSLCVYGVIPMK